jgi:hypothetical protein
MTKFDVSILEYLGKVEGGVLTLVSIVYESKYYEATFFYNESDILLTVSEDLEKEVGDIKLHPQYKELLRDLLKKVVPFDQMIDSIDPVNFSRWVTGVIELPNDIAENVDESEIKKDTN